jgi:outer membrane protein OmpA-like peptidoglycan-associated protein
MKYLVSRGVPESSIEVCSYGPNDPKSSKSTSRRVEISVVTD